MEFQRIYSLLRRKQMNWESRLN